MAREIATFAGGCFWGVEADFRKIEGVVETSVGYMGGHLAEPTYEQVCAKTTGHAEVAQVTFDPEQVSYDALLDAFWAMHDPTQVNRQGPDVGDQYRSAIFYHSPEQETEARASMEKLAASGEHDQPIATQIVPASDYWLAEDYHQQYFEKKGMAACPAHLARA